MKLETFFEQFDRFAGAPGAVAKMREMILTLAVQGKLVPQDPNDEPIILSSDKPSEDVLHNIPSNWRWVYLADLAQFINGDRSKNYPSKSYRVDDGVPFINAGHLSSGNVSLDDMDYITEDHFDRLGGGKTQRGDVLYCLRGSLGKCAVVSSISRGAIASSLLILRPKDIIIARYLYTFLTSPLGALMISKYDNGSAQPNLSATNVKKYLLPLPPLAEQKRIVAKVDELMALCDRLEAQQQERETRHAALARASLARFAEAPTPANLQFLFHKSYDITPADLRKTILTLAVQGKLVPQDPDEETAETLLERIQSRKQETGIYKRGIRTTAILDYPYDLPAGWVWSEWDRIALKIGDVDHKMPEQVNEGIPYVSPRDFLPANCINYEGAKRITRDDYVRLAAKIRPEKGDLIYPRYGTIGENRLITENREFLASYSCAVIKTMPELMDPRYQYFFSISEFCRDQARAAENKTTQANVGIKSIKEFLFPLPPLAEQRRIVAKVDELMALVDQLEARLTESRDVATRLLDALVAGLTQKEPA